VASLRQVWHLDARRWVDRFVASDVGLTGLRRASKTTLTVMCAVFSVYLGLQAAGLGASLTVPLLAGIVSLLSSVAVNDPTPRQKKVTMVLLAVVAVCTVFVGTLLAHSQAPKNLALLVIIFVAFYLRRFGPRFLALGMIGFMSFYFSSLIGTTLQQMPLLTAAIIVGVGWAFVFTFVLLPDKPERAVRRMLRSYYAQAALVLDIVCEIAAGEGIDRSREKSLSRRLSKLNDCAIAVEGQMPEDSSDLRTLKAPPDQLRVFTLDILLEGRL